MNARARMINVEYEYYTLMGHFYMHTAEEFEKDANFIFVYFVVKTFSIPLIKTCFEMVVRVHV